MEDLLKRSSYDFLFRWTRWPSTRLWIRWWNSVIIHRRWKLLALTLGGVCMVDYKETGNSGSSKAYCLDHVEMNCQMLKLLVWSTSWLLACAYLLQLRDTVGKAKTINFTHSPNNMERSLKFQSRSFIHLSTCMRHVIMMIIYCKYILQRHIGLMV